MYLVIIDDAVICTTDSFREARKRAEHFVSENTLNELGYESIGFITPCGTDYFYDLAA